jgi:alpha-beta hydrolase superfamily lysophospholipase
MTQEAALPAKEERLEGEGGVKIFVRSWRPEGKIRAVIAIVHGFNSHGGQYSWVAEQFVAKGFAVYALDLRGRGKSSGERFYVEKFSDYLSDVNLLVTLAKEREPGTPLFLLGHSAGGVISCVYTLENQAKLAGLICESFAFKVPAPDFVLAAIKAVSRFVPRAGVLRLKNKDFSRDPKAVRILNDDPLIAHEVQPAHTVAEMVRADERLKKEFPLITLPVFILHGTLDKATKYSGSQFFYNEAGSSDKTLKLYDGHFHDLLNDIGKELVMEDITGWVNAHLAMANAASA